MIKIIKCNTCNEVMATLEKEIITEQDIAIYEANVNCTSKHNTTLMVAIEGHNSESIEDS